MVVLQDRAIERASTMCNPNSPVDPPENARPPPPQTAPDCYAVVVPVDDIHGKHTTAASKKIDTSTTDTIAELGSLMCLSFPIAITALLFYSRSVVSALFLGSLGDLNLAAGSLAIAFANITGYSVLSGLALGMEPLCSQSFGSNNPHLLSLTLQRCILFLLCSSLPIALLWTHMSVILLSLGQNKEITALAQTYLYFSLPDLISFSFIHPIRIYLRAQCITQPLTLAAIFASAVHIPANMLFVSYLKLGARGVAAAAATSNLVLLAFLVGYIVASKAAGWQLAWQRPTSKCLTGWGPIVRLAGPSCASVCLEWWWYEIMIVFCGLLPNPKATVASMGVLIQTTAFLYVFPSSLGLGVSTRVGNELGANRPHRARASSHVSLSVAACVGLASMGLATAMQDRWGRFFTRDEEILRLTRAALPIVGLCELGNCPQTVGCGVLRGSARPGDAANINLGAFYAVGMPVAVGLGFYLGLGFCGLWVGLLSAQICCAGLMLYAVGSTDWDEQARRAGRLTRGGAAEEVEGFLTSIATVEK